MLLAVMSTEKPQGISKTDKDLRWSVGGVHLVEQVTAVVVGIRDRRCWGGY